MSKKWNLTVAPTSLYCLFASNRMKRQVLVNLELYRSTDRANFEDLKVTGNWLLGCLDSYHTNRDEFWLEVAFRRKNYVFFSKIDRRKQVHSQEQSSFRPILQSSCYFVARQPIQSHFFCQFIRDSTAKTQKIQKMCKNNPETRGSLKLRSIWTWIFLWVMRFSHFTKN